MPEDGGHSQTLNFHHLAYCFSGFPYEDSASLWTKCGFLSLGLVEMLPVPFVSPVQRGPSHELCSSLCQQHFLTPFDEFWTLEKGKSLGAIVSGGWLMCLWHVQWGGSSRSCPMTLARCTQYCVQSTDTFVTANAHLVLLFRWGGLRFGIGRKITEIQFW